MKKYFIKDEDGKEMEIVEKEIEENQTHDEVLSEEQRAAISEMIEAAIAKALAEKTPTPAAGDEEHLEGEKHLEGEEPVVEGKEKEEIVKETHDSVKKSAAAVEKQQTKDSVETVSDEEISNAWLNRFKK